jgi:Ribbon-helix-helix protein, copG family
MSEIKSEVVQVRMREDTLEQLDRLKAVVKSSSRSDAVRRAVGIVDILLNTVISGGQIIVEDKKGKQKQILITGLNR